MDKEKVKELADGRVWTGRQAKGVGLIDDFGNLNEVFDRTAELAGIERYAIIELQKEKDLLGEFLFSLTSEFGDRILQALFQKLNFSWVTKY